MRSEARDEATDQYTSYLEVTDQRKPRPQDYPCFGLKRVNKSNTHETRCNAHGSIHIPCINLSPSTRGSDGLGGLVGASKSRHITHLREAALKKSARCIDAVRSPRGCGWPIHEGSDACEGPGEGSIGTSRFDAVTVSEPAGIAGERSRPLEHGLSNTAYSPHRPALGPAPRRAGGSRPSARGPAPALGWRGCRGPAARRRRPDEGSARSCRMNAMRGGSGSHDTCRSATSFANGPLRRSCRSGFRPTRRWPDCPRFH